MTKWNYTKEEWRNFLHWKTRKKGILFFLLHKIMPIRSAAVPEIRVTSDTVWFNNSQKAFQNGKRRIRSVNIREAENINILEIHYEQSNRMHDIHFPIPKGKLREAIMMQERLSGLVP